MQPFPSGQQFEMRHESLSATVVQVGGGLRVLSAGGIEILDGFGVKEMCHDARGDLLIPWPNRLADGTYSFQGQTEHVPINEPSHNNAIHGLVRWSNWQGEAESESAATMRHHLYPRPGYPFALDLAVRYELSSSGLGVEMRATNAGTGPCPFGAGQHPYFRMGTDLIDAVHLQIPAESMFRYNDQLIPVEKKSVSGSDLDFRQAREIGTTEINMDFTDLRRGDGELARVVMTLPSQKRSLTVWMDSAFRHVTVYTGETVEPAGRRRQGLAIEPMTCPPNALASGQDLVVLQPGETWVGRWGVELAGF